MIRHAAWISTRVRGSTSECERGPIHSPAATAARMPDAPTRSATMNAASGVISDSAASRIVSSVRLRASTTSAPAAKPTATPPAIDSARPPAADSSENDPATTAVDATFTSAKATPSLSRLSPWITPTSRGSAPSRPSTWTGATASVAASAAPSANDGPQPRSKTRCAATATTPAVTPTSTDARSAIERALRASSATGAKNASAYSSGATKRRSTSCGSSRTCGSPGTNARPTPASTSATGYGTPIRRDSQVSASAAASSSARVSAMSIGSMGVGRRGGGGPTYTRLPAVEDAEFRAMLAFDDRHWWYRGRRRVVAAVLEGAGIPPAARLLDAGAGSGRTLDELARYGDVAGIELNPLGVEAARRRGHADVRAAPVEAIPHPDASFHLVTCLDVIEHTDDDVRSLRELRRVTRADGCAIVTVPAYPRLWSRHDEVNRHR